MQQSSNEKLHLENARKLRGIYFIDPEDKECKETIKNARKKLETSVAPGMLCKTSKNSKHGETRDHDFKSKCAYILEASESTRLRMGESLPNHHEDHIAGKGSNSLQHYNLVHKMIPMPQAIKIPAAKAAVDKEWEKLEKFRRDVYHDTNALNHGPVSKTQLFLLNGICTVIVWLDYYGKGNLRKSYCSTVGKRFPISNACSYTVKKGYSYLCMWMT